MPRSTKTRPAPPGTQNPGQDPRDSTPLHHIDSNPGCRFQKSTARNAPSHLHIIFVFVWKPLNGWCHRCEFRSFLCGRFPSAAVDSRRKARQKRSVLRHGSGVR